jgi:peptide-methionine (S)-S-oxide reductase
VAQTTVGYIGGSTPNPTYHAIADHAEAVEVRFDPEVLGEAALLALFWAEHDPAAAPRSTQYRAALYPADGAQAARFEASRAALEAALGAPVRTPILPGHLFYPAEGYHQKWRLRRCADLWRELSARFPDEASLLASTAAARLNGLVGRADPVGAERLGEACGLSEKGRRILAKGGR